MRNIIIFSLLLCVAAVAIACSGNSGGSITNDSPSAAFKRLYDAVKSKDTEKIKATMTKPTQEFADAVAAKNGTGIDKVYENGFTATTFSEKMPEFRDERTKDNMGALEVWNDKDKVWEDLPFILEDGQWKLAVGELFKDTYKSPGKGRDRIEKEAANAMNPNSMLPMNGAPGNSNSNANSKTMSNVNVQRPPMPAENSIKDANKTAK